MVLSSPSFQKVSAERNENRPLERKLNTTGSAAWAARPREHGVGRAEIEAECARLSAHVARHGAYRITLTPAFVNCSRSTPDVCSIALRNSSPGTNAGSSSFCSRYFFHEAVWESFAKRSSQ